MAKDLLLLNDQLRELNFEAAAIKKLEDEAKAGEQK